jgi:hypothetical protein
MADHYQDHLLVVIPSTGGLANKEACCKADMKISSDHS